MVTNGGVRTIIREETKDISEDLASIRRDLEDLTDKVDNTVGPPKEIDHAVERIASIELQSRSPAPPQNVTQLSSVRKPG